MHYDHDAEFPCSTVTAAAGSDYGSDIDADTWDDVFSQSESQPVQPFLEPDVENVDEPVLPQQGDAEDKPRSLRLANIRQKLESVHAGLDNTSQLLANRQSKVAVEYEQIGEKTVSGEQASVQTYPDDTTTDLTRPTARETSVDPAIDFRSPLERFRTRPKKPLSVTDIVSPAWCELQYWYSLTKYGRIRRTKAMKQGSKIHKEKEREVHTEVPIQTTTREDNFGLRLWNIIQGLRILRATGLTRELEVFGTVEGEVIIGIIDELSYRCPDEGMEEQIQRAVDEQGYGSGKHRSKDRPLPSDQTTLQDFLAPGSKADSKMLDDQPSWRFVRGKPKTLYLVDIKTRQSQTLPKLGSQMRATQMQLMLYRRLLNNLAANTVEADKMFERYSVDPNTPFSDTFTAQLVNFDLSSIEDSVSSFSDEPFGGSASLSQPRDPLDEILSHNTLSSLWSLMMSEFARTISVTSTTTSISPLLTAEFRAASDGSLIGRRCFPFDAGILDAYVQDEMRWWRGERRAHGVDVEEAYKCGMCEFSEGCEWRIGKVEQATKAAKARREASSGKAKGSEA